VRLTIKAARRPDSSPLQAEIRSERFSKYMILLAYKRLFFAVELRLENAIKD
jgi:hypothetical protein